MQNDNEYIYLLLHDDLIIKIDLRIINRICKKRKQKKKIGEER